MSDHPLRLLLSGYGLAALTALGLAAIGGGVIAPLLVFWLGGAVLVILLAITPGLSKIFRRSQALSSRYLQIDEMNAEIARWSADRLSEIVAQQRVPSRRVG